MSSLREQILRAHDAARAVRPGPAAPAVGAPPRAAGPAACVYAEPECRGCKARPKVRCFMHGVVVPASACAHCAHPLPLSGLQIGAVITAWNEGEEVAATIESLRASVRHARLAIILVDDGSTDGSCAPSTWTAGPGTSDAVRVVRHDVPLGVGRSRNEGWAEALRSFSGAGCHVVTCHDAHMRFPADVLEQLAVMAVQRRCIVSSASRGIPSKGTLAGCWMHYDASYGLQPRWATGLPPGWQRTACMMGAGYAVSAETGRLLEAATGSLWEDTAGRWGFSEQALSVKAYLLDIPVLTNRGLALEHRYREANPVPGAAREAWKNVARATAVLFGPKVYKERFGAWCEAHVPAADLARILADAAQHAPASWPVDPESFWTHLLGEDAPAAAGAVAGVAQSPTLHSYGAGAPPPAVAVEPSPVVTVCLLSWKRPENLAPILGSIAAQTVPARVMLWQNSSTGSGQAPQRPVATHPLPDTLVQAGRNLGCFPRWWLASLATTEWVCSLDDDLCFAAPDALEAALAAARGAPDSIVGAYGVRLLPGRSYREGDHVNLPAGDVRVDIVKGRFMLLRRALLERVPLHVPAMDALGPLTHREDDVWLSLCIGKGRERPHLLAGGLRGKLRELPQRGVSASAQAGHYERRQRAIELLRAWNEGRST